MDIASQAVVSAVGENDAAAVTVSEANGRREGLLIYNDTDAIQYVKLGPAAASTDFSFKMGVGDLYELPPGSMYQGVVTARSAAAGSGNLRVTEIFG